MRIISLAVLICFFLSLWGCLPQEETAAPEKKPVPVTVKVVTPRDLPIQVEAMGRLKADREVTLSVEVSGKISKINADMGDRVRAGQVLVALDAKDYALALTEARAAYSSAKASFYAARSSFDRAKKLLPQRLVTPDAYEKSEAEYLCAKAALDRAVATVDMAARRLEKTSVTAPFDGHLAERYVEVGQTVGLGQYLGQPMVLLVDLEQMRAMVHLSEADYVHLDKNDPVSVTVDALPDRIFTGRVDKIGLKADARTNTFPAEILVDNPDYTLKAGMTGRVRMTVYTLKKTVMIPQSAVLYREEGQEVFIIQDRTAVKRPVKLGRTEGGLIQVTEGLSPGDSLVTSGGQYLEAGDRVEIAPPLE